MSSEKLIDKAVTQVLLFSTIFAVTVLLGIVDAVCLVKGVSAFTILLLSNCCAGAMAGVVVFQRQLRKNQRLEALEENLQTIRDMNHEVRTMLGVVGFYGTQTNNEYALKVFDEGFKRMESIMRRVLSIGRHSDLKISSPELPRKTLRQQVRSVVSWFRPCAIKAVTPSSRTADVSCV